MKRREFLKFTGMAIVSPSIFKFPSSTPLPEEVLGDDFDEEDEDEPVTTPSPTGTGSPGPEDLDEEGW